MDRRLFFPFAGTAHQYPQDPIIMRFLPLLFHAGYCYEANRSAVGRDDDIVGGRGVSI